MGYFKRKRTLIFTPQPRLVPQPVWRRAFDKFMIWVKRLCFFLGAVFLGSFVLSFLLSGLVSPSAPPSLPSKMVLVFPIEEPITERTSPLNLFNPLYAPQLSLFQITETLEKAARDKRVQGVVFSLRNNPGGLAHMQELRTAIKKFRDTGKFAKIYSVSFGEEASGLGAYYLASAFDEIWMQPVGTVMLEGFRAEMPYLRGTLDKIGVEPEFFQRKEYKSVMENMTSSKMSSYTKETYTKLLGDLNTQVVNTIAQDRKVAPQQVQAWVHKALLTAEEAVENKLIDRLDYSDTIIEELIEKVTGKKEIDYKIFVNIVDYAYAKAHEASFKGKRETVAIVYATGPIVMDDGSRGRGSYFEDSSVASARQLSDILYDVAESQNVKGLVLRIDSPGGSPTASETIRRALLKVKEKGKVVYVSMGAMAASGGYWIAADADKIYAMPATLTGSIGVAGGKFNMSKLWTKLGVNWESISFGDNAGMMSFNQKFSPSQQERFEASLDAIYNGFITRVSEGRKMTPEKAEALAKGQVYTGLQAKEVGLVDELGGLPETLDGMAQKLGVKDRSKLEIVTLPKPETKLQKLLDLISQQVELHDWMRGVMVRMSLMQNASMGGVLALETRLGF